MEEENIVVGQVDEEVENEDTSIQGGGDQQEQEEEEYENNFDDIIKRFNEEDYEEEEPGDKIYFPIGMHKLNKPMYSPYGHFFEKEKIEKWLSNHDTCPITREPLTMEMMKPVIYLDPDGEEVEEEVIESINNEMEETASRLVETTAVVAAVEEAAMANTAEATARDELIAQLEMIDQQEIIFNYVPEHQQAISKTQDDTLALAKVDAQDDDPYDGVGELLTEIPFILNDLYDGVGELLTEQPYIEDDPYDGVGELLTEEQDRIVALQQHQQQQQEEDIPVHYTNKLDGEKKERHQSNEKLEELIEMLDGATVDCSSESDVDSIDSPHSVELLFQMLENITQPYCDENGISLGSSSVGRGSVVGENDDNEQYIDQLELLLEEATKQHSSSSSPDPLAECHLHLDLAKTLDIMLSPCGADSSQIAGASLPVLEDLEAQPHQA
ncbi:hypothetical protein SAMD00019534_103890 [Acytostelium subglobosum LB1]|uniref:hypothetical protein n=1 Tax=Acytostelium subglobosum LB1 TaxID=1410327 RepID=UPI00064498DA|nr:hypothetical protein SAMD00019534_103890 [Acytostelium subglobosum LB1]GAM27214.1 hypothetical protein SAMD00019534_103890 [Acytostelium subglobosum LB1]|eukprot:XP_012749681.1 hypothetical protein SAMD00019534_103890 [Acytostelium subglobosum LB1]